VFSSIRNEFTAGFESKRNAAATDTNCALPTGGHMTRWSDIDVPGPAAFGLALIIGASGSLAAASYLAPNDPPRRLSQAQQRQQSVPSAPVPVPVQVQVEQKGFRVGDWRASLFTSDEDVSEATQLASDDDGPAIAIVIDDLGASVARTKTAIALPAGITMSFLPYPDTSDALSHSAFLAGHEVIVHLPMQPEGNENPGTQALLNGLPASELQARTAWALARVSDYDGVNNHMGSLFTASRDDLMPVMQELKDSGLFFLDSRTTGKSKAEAVARELGIMTGGRDVFLDDEQSADAVERQLALVEELAQKNGTVIAIGHPHDQTLKSLDTWTKSLKSRGCRRLPLQHVLKLREKDRSRASLPPPVRNG